MNKQKINYTVDLTMLFSFLITAISGIVICFFLPGNVGHGGPREFLEISKHNWSIIHRWAGLIMITSGLIHFFLHLKEFLIIAKAIFSKKY